VNSHDICSARTEKESGELETLFAVVYSHGLVHWWTAIGQSVAHCPMDITWFPLDTQNCPLIYESWAMPSAQLNITPLEQSVDFTYYQNSGEWQVIGNNAVLYEFNADVILSFRLLFVVRYSNSYQIFLLLLVVWRFTCFKVFELRHYFMCTA